MLNNIIMEYIIYFHKSEFKVKDAERWLKRNHISNYKKLKSTKKYFKFCVVMTLRGGSFISEVARHIKGIVSAIKGYRTNLPPQTREVLEANNNGNSNILKIKVCRKPLKGIYQKTIDTVRAISGATNEPHDKLFHLYMIAYLENGNAIQVEKEQDLKASYYTPDSLESSFEINLTKPLTINKMFETTLAKIGERSFYHYDAFKDNCQKFIYDNLTENGIKLSQDQKNFIMQKVDNLVPMWAKRITGFLTDLANRGRMAIFGYGSPNLQAVIFPKDAFTKATANRWLNDHQLTKIKPLHTTTNYYRARIQQPPKNARYYIKTLPNGVKLVLLY
jgi:hypothetical protein